MSGDIIPLDNRPGTTQREFDTWLTTQPNDPTAATMARTVMDMVASWQAGERDTRATLHGIVDLYQVTDGDVSEGTSAMLNQATMWFGYEAGVEPCSELDEEILQRLLTGE